MMYKLYFNKPRQKKIQKISYRQGKIFVKPISDTFPVYKEHLKLNNKKISISI